MKKGIVILIIGVLIIGFCSFELVFLRDTFDKIEADLILLKAELNIDIGKSIDALSDAPEAGGDEAVPMTEGRGYALSGAAEISEEAVKTAERINDFWQKRKKWAQVMINNTLLIEYNGILDRLLTNMATNEVPMVIVELNSLYRMNNELREFNSPRPQNVF